MIHRIGALAVAVVAAAIALAGAAAAQEIHRQHPPQDMPLHEKFYQGWYMPDNPSRSCCNKADCYPTTIEYRDGQIYARRREDGKMLRIPAAKIERNRDNPDGRSHMCAPPPPSPTLTVYPPDTVFCFTLGTGS